MKRSTKAGMQRMRWSVAERVLRLGVAAFFALVVSACGGIEEPTPRPLPEEDQALRAGVYRSEEFEPSLTFRVGEGWTTRPPEMKDALLISRGDAGLSFAAPQEFYKPTRLGTPDIIEAPEDMVGWHQQHPYLQTTEPEPVTIGGVEGERFDILLGDVPEDYYGRCSQQVGMDCVDLARVSDGSLLFIGEGFKVRVAVLEDVKGERVAIGTSAPTAEFDEFAPEAKKVLDSVEWMGT